MDLRGGSYLLLEVETDSIKNDRSQSLLEDIRSTFRKNKIKYSGLKTNQNGIQVFIRDEDQISEARKLIQESNVSSSNLFSSNINKEFSILIQKKYSNIGIPTYGRQSNNYSEQICLTLNSA